MTVRDAAPNTSRRGLAQRGLYVAAVAVVLGGCRFAQQGVQAVILEPINFAEYLEEKHEHRQHLRVANQVWSEIQESEPISASKDYRRGFHDGFVDFMMAGGTGAPPPFPPKDYWKTHYQTREGHQAILDWYAGFGHGTSLADESGYRDLVTLPLYAFPYEPDSSYSSLNADNSDNSESRAIRTRSPVESIERSEELPLLSPNVDEEDPGF